MIPRSSPADPAIYGASTRIARRCRRIIRGILREEEWGEADREFDLVAREEIERLDSETNGE